MLILIYTHEQIYIMNIFNAILATTIFVVLLFLVVKKYVYIFLNKRNYYQLAASSLNGCTPQKPALHSSMLPILRLSNFVQKESPEFVPSSQTIFRPGTFEPTLYKKMHHVADTILTTMNAYNATSFSVVKLHKIVEQEASSKNAGVKYLVDFEAHDTISNSNKNILLHLVVLPNMEDYTITKLEERTAKVEPLCSQFANDSVASKNEAVEEEEKTTEPCTFVEQPLESSLEHTHVQASPSDNGGWESPYEQSCRQATASFPSNRIYSEWNRLSLHRLHPAQNSSGGYNYSFRKRPCTPSFNPTLSTLPRESAAHTMFDKSRGITGFPHAPSAGK